MQSRDYWEARVAEMRKYAPNNEVVSLNVSDDRVDVVLHHTLPRLMLPKMAQTRNRKMMVITRKESWARSTTTRPRASSPAMGTGPGSLTPQ